MNEYKITFSNGDIVYTKFNGTKEETERYYIGEKFNVGDNSTQKFDKMIHGVKVEQINK